MRWFTKAWKTVRLWNQPSGSEGRSFGGFKRNVSVRARQKSIRVFRDLIIVFMVFAATLFLASVLDLHGSFEAASLQLKDSPFQYDELMVALAILAAALSVFAIRRWRELETEIVERVQVETRLIDSEERYRTLAEAAHDFIFIVNRVGLIQYLNSYAAGKLGQRPEAAVGRPLDMVFPGEMARIQKVELKKVFADGHALSLENEATLEGRKSWLSTSLVPIMDENGEFKDVLGISRDITERKMAEDALQQAKDGLEVTVGRRTRELKSLNQQLKLELDEKKLAQERLQAVNRALRTTLAANQALTGAANEQDLLKDICKAVVEVGGYRFAWVGLADDNAGKTVQPVASAGYEDGFLGAVDVSWDAGDVLGDGPVGRAIRFGGPSVVRDILIDDVYAPWRPEATRRGFASTVSLPLAIDSGNIGALSIYAAEPDAFDEEEVMLLSELAVHLSYGITALRTRGERDQQAVALKRTGEQLSLLLESLPIIFYTSLAKDDFGLTYVSNNITGFTGYKPEELIGDPSFWADRVHPDDAPLAFEEIPKVFDRGFHEYEYRWRGADGSYKWFLDILRLVRTAEGEEDYIVGMWLDITARKHGEQRLLKVKDKLEEESRAKSADLAAAVERLAAASGELERYQCQAVQLGQMDELMQSCLNAGEAYAAFARFAPDVVPGTSGALYIRDEADGMYRTAASWGGTPPKAKEFAANDCWSLRLGQVHVYPETEVSIKCNHTDSDDLYICSPVRAIGDTFGVLVLLRAAGGESGGVRVSELKQAAETMAGRLAMTVYSLNLRRTFDEKGGKRRGGKKLPSH